VDYPGKQATAAENAGVELAGRRDGRFFLHWPDDFDLRREVTDQVAIFWTPAPPARVLLLALGLTLIPLGNVLAALLAGNGLPGRSWPAGRPLSPARQGLPARRGVIRRTPAARLAARPRRV
jgi:hypothetical protein